MKNMNLWLRDSSNKLIAKVHMTKNRLFTLNLKTIDAKCLMANVLMTHGVGTCNLDT